MRAPITRRTPQIRAAASSTAAIEQQVDYLEKPLKRIDGTVADAQAFDELEESFEKVLSSTTLLFEDTQDPGWHVRGVLDQPPQTTFL